MDHLDLGAELQRIASAHRHVRNEHQREGVDGGWRRRLEHQLDELAGRFETLLARWVNDDELRRQWQDHLYQNAPEPPLPRLARPPVFRGRLVNRGVIEVQQGSDGDYDVFVDGMLVDRLSRALRSDDAARSAVPASDAAIELFDAPGDALEALGRAATSGSSPPWEWAVALYEDGLIDPAFALTPRGRRFVSAWRSAVSGGEVAWR